MAGKKWKDRLPDGKEGVLKVILAGAGLLFLGAFVDRGLGYLTRIILAKFMTPTEYGLLFLSFSVLSVMITLVLFGLNTAVSRYVAYYRGRKDYAGVKGVIMSSLKVSAPISVAAFLAMLFFSGPLSVYVFNEPALAPLIAMLSFVMLTAPIMYICLAAAEGFQTMRYEVYLNKIGKTVFTIVITVALLLMGFGVVGAALSYLMGYVITFVLAVYLLNKSVFPIFSKSIKGRDMKWKMLSFAWPFVLSGVIWDFNGEMGTLFLGALKGPLDVGMFQSALPNTKLLRIIPSALTGLFFPIVATMLGQKKTSWIRRISKKNFKWVFYLNFPVFMIMLLFPSTIMNVTFGPEYAAAVPLLSVLAIGYFIYPMATFSVSLVNTYGKTRLNFINSVICISINLVLSLLLIPSYGPMGAAIAMTSMFFVYVLLYMLQAYKISGILPFTWRSLCAVPAGVAAALFVYAIDAAMPIITVYMLAPILAGFFIIYGLLLLGFGGVERDDAIVFGMVEKRLHIRLGFLRRLARRFVR